MTALITRIMDGPNKTYRLAAKVGDNERGFEFKVKSEATKARARLIKRLKVDGFRVECV